MVELLCRMFRVDFYAVSIVIIYHFPVRISFASVPVSNSVIM